MTPEEARFWAKVKRSDSGCWNWTASTWANGYGQFKSDGRMVAAHRFAYERVRGNVPDGLQLDHLCRNRLCVNPDHLEAVSQRENILRGMSPSARQARQTHCRKGHEFTAENTYSGTDGRRRCRACHYAYNREWRKSDVA